MKRLPYITLLAMAGLWLTGCGDGGPTSVDGEWSARAIDGDTFMSSSTGDSWRLARIDTPELPGHCRPGRDCVKGDPIVAKVVLQSLLDNRPIKCKLIDTDVYGRNIGECFTKGGKNISNEMLRLGVAEEYRR